MDQVEILKKTLVAKNSEIMELRKLIKAGVDVTAEKTTLEKCLWGMLFALLEKYVPCEKCRNRTSPCRMKTNYVVVRCNTCGHLMDLKRKKDTVFNAYFNKFKGKFNG